jgi:hypothetical protein
MYQKKSLLFLVLIIFISLCYTKSFSSNEFKYILNNKKVEYNLNELRLTMNFEGIHQNESDVQDDDFQVKYTANFYNQENSETPIYSRSMDKKGKDTKGRIDWPVDIEKNDEKNQTVIIMGEASYNGDTENFEYDPFYIKYTEKEDDKTVAFWVIYFSFIGAIIITFGVMYVYFYATLEIGRDTLMLNNLNSGLNESKADQEKDNKEENTRTTA